MKEKHTYHHAGASGKLPEAWRVNPYTVPNGYFESLPLRTIQSCKNTGNAANTFGVPDGYFEQLADSITAKVAEQTLKDTVERTGFVVPDGYFDASAQQLQALHKLNERVRDTGFTIPAQYFDTLPRRIGSQTQRAAPAIRTLRRPKWAVYAAAASIAVVLGLVGMFKIAQDTSAAKSPLASVSDEQIFDYLELYGPPNDMIYISEQLDDFDEQRIGEGISEDDIEAYLNHTL